MTSALLPPSTTPLMKAVAEACADLVELEVKIRDSINPDLCRPDFLPFLAWARSVDRWDADWSISTQRQVVKSAPAIHRMKGTVASLRRVAAAMGYEFEIEEWFESSAPRPAGSFIVHLRLGITGITQATVEKFTRLVDDTRPESRHATLQMQLEIHGAATPHACTTDGELLSVRPIISDMQSQLNAYRFTGLTEVTTTLVQPLHETPHASGMPRAFAAIHIIDTLEIRP